MPADARFVTREYRDGDEAAILELFARSFPHAPRTLAHFNWKYRENPFGNERISLTLDEENHLVGHYAGYAVPFRMFDRDVLAHQIGDTMTDVSVRHVGRGPTSILGRTALHFYEHFCENQVAFNYGFNVANIHKFSLRFLRADRVEPVTFRMLDLRKHPLRPMSRLSRRLRGYSLELVRHVNPEWDELFARAANGYRFLVRRDARYVRWRFLDAPDLRYTLVAIRRRRVLVGWIAYRLAEGRLLWGDALFDPQFPDAIDAVLRHVAPLHSAKTIAGWFPPRPEWFDAKLRSLGFETEAEPNDLSVMCVPFAEAEATAAMRDALYYTWADSDLF
ncbi:MAG: hypothetical protein DMF56_20630 [Acidobacteria bacterium]|nr:MAG: hypothetical protein DMF56_20630 [Acidobacteriota bacterium]